MRSKPDYAPGMNADAARAARLRQAREKAGFDNPTAAAEALGVRPSTYYGHENGSRGFDRAAQRYARRFGVDPAWLLYGTAPAPAAPPGLAESPVSEYRLPPGLSAAETVAPGLRHRMTYRVDRAAPELALLAGDVVVVEAQGAAAAGDIVLARHADTHGHAETVLGRWLPPWIVGSGAPLDTSDGHTAILSVVRGVLRGIDPGERK